MSEDSSSDPSASTAGQPISPGERFPRAFGEYLLLTSFGRGGMGEVYLAKRSGLEGIEQLCVVKRLRADLNEEEEYVRRFIDEARVVVQLAHANICKVFDVGKVGADHFLAMEYVQGVNLRAVTERLAGGGRRLEPGLALYVMAEVLDALDYAHRHEDPATGERIHLVHRDVSPHNVMVSFQGEVKLIDFGLAASELKAEKTESHVVMGKVAYMSPEQARGDDVDATTDQFAAGIMLYELLTGVRFYGTRRLHEIWQIVGLGNFLPDELSSVPEGVRAILQRVLSGRPEDRYATCEELKEDLLRYLHAHHPGMGTRQLRELMKSLFADEVARHRQVLRDFQDLDARTVQSATEVTMSFASRSTSRSPVGPWLGEDSGSRGTVTPAHSLPTSVVPRAQALDPTYQQQDTEATASATVFVGPKGDPREESVAVKVGRPVAMLATAGLLVLSGLGAGIFLAQDGPAVAPPGPSSSAADPAGPSSSSAAAAAASDATGPTPTQPAAAEAAPSAGEQEAPTQTAGPTIPVPSAPASDAPGAEPPAPQPPPTEVSPPGPVRTTSPAPTGSRRRGRRGPSAAEPPRQAPHPDQPAATDAKPFEEVKAPAPAPAPTQPKRAQLSLQQKLDALKRCPASCASTIQRVLEGDPDLQKFRPLIERCYENDCRPK